MTSSRIWPAAALALSIQYRTMVRTLRSICVRIARSPWLQQQYEGYSNRVMTPRPLLARQFGYLRAGARHTFVFPSRNKSFMPSLMNSGWEMNSKVTVARSPVRRIPCGWSMLTMRTVCRTACAHERRKAKPQTRRGRKKTEKHAPRNEASPSERGSRHEGSAAGN